MRPNHPHLFLEGYRQLAKEGDLAYRPAGRITVAGQRRYCTAFTLALAPAETVAKDAFAALLRL